MSAEAKPSVLLARGFPPDPAPPDFAKWFETIPLRAEDPAPAIGKPVPPPTPPAGPSRARPSDSGHSSLLGSALFAESSGLALGTEVHEVLAEIEWFPPPVLPSTISLAARGVLKEFLSAPEIAPVFDRPSPESEVWRERSVACRLDGINYSAQMDRVIVTPPEGKTGKGKILLVDFKTDQGEPAEIATRYKSQLEIYARILATWSGGRHDITAAVATVRKPALITVC